MVSRVVDLGLRGLEFIWTLLVLSLIGNIIASAISGNPSVINFCIFVAVFSMLSLIYLVLVAFNDSFMGHPMIPVVLDTLNTLFFFCAAVALAAELGAHSCSNNNYTLHNHITNGAVDRSKRCREAQASDAFLWFGFATYLVSLVFSIFAGRGNGNLGGIRKGGPVMSQVRA